MSARPTLPDGLEALLGVLKLPDIMRYIEYTARWVAPETFKVLPVWFPEYARGAYFYKADWSAPQMNTNRQTKHSIHKREGNLYANKALTMALGLRSDARPNWSCCHIWGVDDATYQERNAVVQNHRFYSCVANMVLLPTPLKAFTDTMPEVKAMLRICARNLYGWHCDHESIAASVAVIDTWGDWSAYPASWPRNPGTGLPPGVMPLSPSIKADASLRLARIRRDLEQAGTHYPRQEVLEALAHWEVGI